MLATCIAIFNTVLKCFINIVTWKMLMVVVPFLLSINMYLDFTSYTFAAGSASKNPQFSMCLSNYITRNVIMLESYSNPQKTRHFFESPLKIYFWFWIFFVSDVISEVVLGLFGPPHLALGPNC